MDVVAEMVPEILVVELVLNLSSRNAVDVVLNGHQHKFILINHCESWLNLELLPIRASLIAFSNTSFTPKYVNTLVS